MNRNPLRRTRLAAVAALSLAGIIAAGAVTPATAGDCLAVSVGIYKNRQGYQYVGNQRNCVAPTPWNTGYHSGKWVENDTHSVPAGTPSGAGYGVWVPLP